MNFNPSKLHPLRHRGRHFQLNGALNVARSPQGRPFLIQAVASAAGKDFGAEHAEAVFGSDDILGEGQAFCRDLGGRLAKFGRDPSSLKILAGLPVVVGST